MRLSGFTGEVRWSYLVAATFGPWTLTNHELSGQIVSCDEYRITQKPLIVVVRIGRQELSYPVVQVQQQTDEQLVITLGERMSEHGQAKK